MSDAPIIEIDGIKIDLSDFDYEDCFQMLIDAHVKKENTGANTQAVHAMQMRDLEVNLRSMTEDGRMHRFRSIEVTKILNELMIERVKNQGILSKKGQAICKEMAEGIVKEEPTEGFIDLDADDDEPGPSLKRPRTIPRAREKGKGREAPAIR